MERILMEHSNTLSSNTFVVNWCMGNKCNYNCNYCIELLNGGDREWTKFEVVEQFTMDLLNHLKETNGKKNVLFEFTGGEITLHKELPKILSFIKKNACNTCIISNGSRKPEYWNEIKTNLDYCVLSYHADHCDIEHFMDVVEILNTNVTMYLNIMMHPLKFDQCKKVGVEIRNKFSKIPVSFQPILKNLIDDPTLREYTIEQKNELNELQLNSIERNSALLANRYRSQITVTHLDGSKKVYQPEQFIYEKSNNWFGWLCWAGCEQLVIGPDGDVFRAWCAQDWIGNVKTERIQFPKVPTFCQRNICHCNMDIVSRKQRLVTISAENNQIKYVL